MIYYKKPNEVELIRENCLLVCRTLALVGEMLKPGITGNELDQEAEAFIRDHDAKPAFKGYRGFPASLCISPNEEVVHGIPNDKEFQEGDIVSIDCGVEKNKAKEALTPKNTAIAGTIAMKPRNIEPGSEIPHRRSPCEW